MLPFQTEDRRIRRPAHSGGILGDGVHDRLEIGRRACDHAQDLRRGRLLVQRLRQLSVSRLQLLEQPHVLDGDHRLVGEGPQQRNLLVGERLDLGASDPDRADGCALAQQRNAQEGAVAELPSEHAAFRKLLHLGLEIRHLDGLPIKHRAPVHRAANHGHSKPQRIGDRAMVGHQTEDVAV